MAKVKEIKVWGKTEGYLTEWGSGYTERFYGKYAAEKAQLSASGIMQSMDDNTPLSRTETMITSNDIKKGDVVGYTTFGAGDFVTYVRVSTVREIKGRPGFDGFTMIPQASGLPFKTAKSEYDGRRCHSWGYVHQIVEVCPLGHHRDGQAARAAKYDAAVAAIMGA